MKDTFTTGEAARVCRMSQQTVIRCIDRGDLRGHRVPGSKFRRVLHADLARFLDARGLPRDLFDAALDRRGAAAPPAPPPAPGPEPAAAPPRRAGKKGGGRDFYTTGEVARVCRVSAQTAIRWIDQGRLRSYRVPDSKFRRVLHADLARFLDERGLPRDRLDATAAVAEDG